MVCAIMSVGIIHIKEPSFFFSLPVIVMMRDYKVMCLLL